MDLRWERLQILLLALHPRVHKVVSDNQRRSKHSHSHRGHHFEGILFVVERSRRSIENKRKTRMRSLLLGLEIHIPFLACNHITAPNQRTHIIRRTKRTPYVTHTYVVRWEKVRFDFHISISHISTSLIYYTGMTLIAEFSRVIIVGKFLETGSTCSYQFITHYKYFKSIVSAASESLIWLLEVLLY